jgi:hypothetical protein
MPRQFPLVFLVSVLLLAAVLPSTVVAGGWAVVSLDAMPTTLRPGQSYRVGYAVLQHGTTPLRNGSPQLRLRLGSTERVFPGHEEGPPGHYVSDVSLPEAGRWTWFAEAYPPPFPAQALGTIEVAQAAPPARAPFPIEIAGAAVVLVGLALLAGVLKTLLQQVAKRGAKAEYS